MLRTGPCSINQLHLCTKRNPKHLIYFRNPLCIRRKNPIPNPSLPTKPTQSSSAKLQIPTKTLFGNNASEMRELLDLESWKISQCNKGRRHPGGNFIPTFLDFQTWWKTLWMMLKSDLDQWSSLSLLFKAQINLVLNILCTIKATKILYIHQRISNNSRC